ncbi:MAG TPA: glycosyltransferase family 39 protein [Blastocatellia bacterium]|nr:glycosyltransferase family 39 protein [Blastocatellia bacterium]
MRRKILSLLFAISLVWGAISAGNALALSPEIGLGIVAGFVAAFICLFAVMRGREDRQFLLKLFIAALILRCIVGYLIYSKGLQPFFGGDAETYNAFGNALSQSWQGLVDPNAPWLTNYTNTQRSGWGMFYYVAAVYYVIGQNPLAIVFINCALGAVACVVAYRIAMLVYPNQRVARTSALLTAFSPSMILWSSQLLKDGPIVLFLCLCTLFTLKLRNRFEGKSFILLLISLFCIYSLRYYTAYIIFIAMAGTFLLTAKRFTPARIIQGALLVIVLGTALAYFAGGDIEQMAGRTLDLKSIQMARVWGAKVSESGFGGDVDITDPQAALAFLPLGILYVLFAPFPWMIGNLRQLITLPELVAWWLLVPFLLRGYFFALRHRLRESFAITVFTVSLTIAYALYQSNVGTAYRHRAQLYVFFFIFISIGLELRRAAKQKRRFKAIIQPPQPMAAATIINVEPVGQSSATV